MTVLRLISLPAHAALEFAAGLVLMVAPFLFGFTPAGLVVTLLAGAVVAGQALSAISHDGAGIPVTGHLAFDRTLSLALVIGALALALHGDRAAGIALLAGALTQLALTTTTRYTARR